MTTELSHRCGKSANTIGQQDHNDWIEKEDFDIFLHAILMTHPGLEFLLETQAGDGRGRNRECLLRSSYEMVCFGWEPVEIPEAQTLGSTGCTSLKES